MGLKCRVIFEAYDELDGRVQSRNELVNVNIKRPETIDEIGLDYESQIALIQSTLDKIIELQGSLINKGSISIIELCSQFVKNIFNFYPLIFPRITMD